jgi:amino acid adenylation domain-containing protein
MMDTTRKVSCFVLGAGTLTLKCAEILLERGHTIYGMISSDAALRDGARERGIPYADPKSADIVSLLSRHPFDYLFSIVNMSILPERVLALPLHCAINFHDAPLPRYAGVYATSWAILQGERVHGVTWHAMTNLVDAGDILKQALFEIDDRETAFTLNAKCYDAAISSFAELMDDIAAGRVSIRKQDLNERTFFPLSKRPSPGCILSWNRSAREIGAFVRALDFGSYPNPLGLPKLAVEGDFLIVSEVEVLDAKYAIPPGTVTRIDPHTVGVSTLDGGIELRKLLTIDGQTLPIADFVAKFGLYEGYRFEELTQETATRITTYHASLFEHEAYWAQQLETLESSITLPYARWKAPSVQTARRSCEPMPVPAEILTPLAYRFATSCTGDVLLAAFAAYLARIAGIGGLDLGYRDSELAREVAALDGIFAAYVPLHVNMEHKQSFAAGFHAVQEQVELTKKRKTYARDIIARSPSLRARVHTQGVYLPSICVDRVEAAHDYEASRGGELTLVIQEDGRECLWVYDVEVFEQESITQMQHQFTAFLQGIASDPQQPISDLPLLNEAERSRLLVEWNATRAAYPDHSCLHHLFEAQVERTPGAVAVVFEDEQLTYQELNGRANQLAHLLQLHGVRPEVLVGLCVERSVAMILGLLGILKAGGAYVPLDPTYPTERIAFMLEDARVQVLVTQQHLLSRLPAQEINVVCLDTAEATLARQNEASPHCEVSSGNLAYVIYTSGSTGRPKGVQITHRAVVNFLLSMREQPGLAAHDTLLAITTLSFDIAALELFLPLLVGAKLIVASRDTAADGAALAGTLSRARVTVMQATPITWRLLLAAGWQGKPDMKILCGGEALPLDLAQQLLPRAASLWNLYGPTETTIWSTCCQIEPANEVISIGRPIANTQVYLLDPQLQPVPIGVPGELYIGGDGLARGYLNRPELTAERFIQHPFNDEAGARLYRTGDLARYRPDGTIEHLGRLDYQVKLRGFRIELGEIETVLARHPAVHQAVVVAREDVPGDKHLAAYVVARQGQTASVGDLQGLVMRQLPAYMVPSAFVLLDAFPLTPNGKVDRRALPVPQRARPVIRKAPVAPRTQLEKLVTGIWSQILGVEYIGIHDDFIALGGDSLMAMQVIARLRKVLQVQVPLARFFEAGTVAELARVIEQVKAGGAQRRTQVPLPVPDLESSRSLVDSALHRLEEKGFGTVEVAVQVGGTRRPFFFLHGDFLHGASYCFPLARHLGPDQPLYAFEPYRFDVLGVPPPLEAMAAAHIESLRSIQPQGPYLLGGFCNGGVVAYEMARQLHAQGETVDLLVLIDPSTLSYKLGGRRVIGLLGHLRLPSAMERTIITTYVVGVMKRLGHLTRLSQRKQVYCFLWLRYTAGHGSLCLQHIYRYLRHAYRYLRYARYRKLKSSERLSYFGVKKFGDAIPESDEQAATGSLPRTRELFLKALFPTLEALHDDWEGKFAWTVSGYEPGMYPGKSTFIFTSDGHVSGWDVDWRNIAETKDEGVEMSIIAAAHDTCKTKHLLALTEPLRLCLDRAQRAGSESSGVSTVLSGLSTPMALLASGTPSEPHK